MRLPRFALMVLLTVIGVLGMTTPAFAHAVLESSTPAQGASLSAPPTEIKLTFGEAVTLPQSPILVAGPGGAQWKLGEPSIAGPVITVPVLDANGPAGPYVLTWRVISDDGDNVSGTIHFTLSTATGGAAATSAAPTSTPSGDFVPGAAPAPAPAGGGGVPVWVWVLIVVVVVVGAGVLVNRNRSRRD